MRVAVVGGGHNGLVAACYLARAGAEVVVLEQAGKLGGGSRTDEPAPGFRFNTHSAAHNIINATDIVADLGLREAGLEYREMDPFSIAVFTDGTIVRFHRSIERTVASIAEADPAEARRYADWMDEAMPVITAMRAGLGGYGRARQMRRLPRQMIAGVQALARNGGPVGLAGLLLQPYGRVLRERLGSELVRAPVSAFAAHASASPDEPGSALFGLWQAFYHQVGQWHAVGGSQGLIDALARRLESYGGQWRTGAAVERITRTGSRVTGVVLESGERLTTDAVVTAIDPRMALLRLLDPPLDGPVADALARCGGATPSRCSCCWRRPRCPGTRGPGQGTGTACSPSWTASTPSRTASHRRTHDACLRTRCRPTPSPPAHSTAAWHRPATTPSTLPARPRPTRCTAAGRTPRRRSPTGWSTPSRNGHRASRTRW
ncbi:NAD(P)/FAD-dependent oxidoreductase [Streptomyces sp. Z423-1]|uniref:phytoene desaturase family protein n=1 Tax=unclassified Streptomyces TaxID=2593676 RepID=UPI00148851D6|nr:NAD(P)/FAD-dependent oxidoreductase [Streptomyces sp. Z423-1]